MRKSRRSRGNRGLSISRAHSHPVVDPRGPEGATLVLVTLWLASSNVATARPCSLLDMVALGGVRTAEDATRVLGVGSILDSAIKFQLGKTQLAVTKSYVGETHAIAGVGEITVGKQLGRGGYGVVHEVTLTNAPPELMRLAPALFEGRNPRSDLVIKFPNPVADPALQLKIETTIRQEASEFAQITEAFRSLGISPPDGSKIVYSSTGSPPFLIKTRVSGALDIEALAKKGLTAEQWRLLRVQILDKARRLSLERQIDLDIRAENLYWVEGAKEWRMYELSLVPKAGNIYTRRSWGGYQHYMEGVLRNYQERGNGD